jgi:hypothetical protein
MRNLNEQFLNNKVRQLIQLSFIKSFVNTDRQYNCNKYVENNPNVKTIIQPGVTAIMTISSSLSTTKFSVSTISGRESSSKIATTKLNSMEKQII